MFSLNNIVFAEEYCIIGMLQTKVANLYTNLRVNCIIKPGAKPIQYNLESTVKSAVVWSLIFVMVSSALRYPKSLIE